MSMSRQVASEPGSFFSSFQLAPDWLFTFAMSSYSLAAACQPSTFSPSLLGGEVLSVRANLVTNFNAEAPDVGRFIAPSVELEDANFCNVIVEYTHPGQGDHVFVETWLPIDNWNSRLQAVGGGGWVAGRFSLTYTMMIGALADGFATVTTDAGVGSTGNLAWALHSPGNVNLNKLNNFGSVALHDQVSRKDSHFGLRTSTG